MKQWQIILSGTGGQGLVIAGVLLGEAATHENKNAAHTQSYGIQSRGGLSISEVVISQEEIIYPGVTEPDLVLALSPLAFKHYAGSLPDNCTLVYDSSQPIAPEMVTPAGSGLRGYPIAGVARELGIPEAVNMVALGLIVGLTGVVSPDSMRKALSRRFAAEALRRNLRGFEAGLELAR